MDEGSKDALSAIANEVGALRIADEGQPAIQVPAAAAAEADVIQAAMTKRREIIHNPKLCSQCLMPVRESGSMFVEITGEIGRIMLCSLRCMAVWAMTRGWAK